MIQQTHLGTPSTIGTEQGSYITIVTIIATIL